MVNNIETVDISISLAKNMLADILLVNSWPASIVLVQITLAKDKADGLLTVLSSRVLSSIYSISKRPE